MAFCQTNFEALRQGGERVRSFSSEPEKGVIKAYRVNKHHSHGYLLCKVVLILTLLVQSPYIIHSGNG
jgi:hypothetical protein